MNSPYFSVCFKSRPFARITAEKFHLCVIFMLQNQKSM